MSFNPARIVVRYQADLAGLLPHAAARSQMAAQPPALRLCVAASGGLDSTALLVALSRLVAAGSIAASLRAVHVDHGLHPDSPRWAEACAAASAALGVACNVLRVAVRTDHADGPEAAAREARYAALAAQLEPGEVLVTAHHADDQLETVLLQWVRGGGLRAVAGMAPLGRFGTDAWHWRPLLETTRSELAEWAAGEGLCWQDDPSNLDPRFDRNYLRLHVLPPLRERWPAVATTVGRVAEYAREALAAEAELVAADLPRVLRGAALELSALLELPDARQRAVLRAWLVGLGLPAPPARTLAALRHDMARAAADRIPETRWPGAIVRRYRGRLHADADVPSPGRAGCWERPTETAYQWSEDSTLVLVPSIGAGFSRARLPERLDVRLRRGGETLPGAADAHRRPLRKWLQERDVLPWRRETLPLLHAGAQLAAVADLGVAGAYAARADEPSWRVEWRGRGVVTEADACASRWPAHPPIR